MNYVLNARTAESVARLRAKAGATQAEVARKASIDQSRVSRMEKGEPVTTEEIRRVLRALELLGSEEADDFTNFLSRKWKFIEPPFYWNPERPALELAEESLAKIQQFIADSEQPWPLRRQLKRRKEDLLRATNYLTRLRHNVAFIGDIGVGKSTAISFVFDLLAPTKANEQKINNTILATGAGRTTICEVHIKGGPEYGICVVPMEDADLTSLVSDFCAAKWAIGREANGVATDIPQVPREFERAIRNMSRLTRKKTKIGYR